MKDRLHVHLHFALLVVLVLSGLLLPANLQAQDSAPNSQLFLPLVSRPHEVKFVVGSWSTGGTRQAGACEFNKAPQEGATVTSSEATTATIESGVCPNAGTYFGLQIIADGVAKTTAIPWQEENMNAAIYTGSSTTVTNVGVIRPDQLEIEATAALPPLGPLSSEEKVKVVEIPFTFHAVQSSSESEVEQDPSYLDKTLFHAKLKQFLDLRGNNPFGFYLPTSVPFWHKMTGLTWKLPQSCGYNDMDSSGPKWVPIRPKVIGLPPVGSFFVDGVFLGFTPNNSAVPMATCMGENRMIRMGDLMTQPWAQVLRNQMVAEVGNWDIKPYQTWTPGWNQDLTYYSLWVAVNATVGGYLIWETAKGVATRGTMYLIVPERLLDCPLVTQQVRCTITNE